MRGGRLHVGEEEDPPLLLRRVVAPRQEVGQHVRPHVLADLGVEQRGDERGGELDARAQALLADRERSEALPDASVAQPGSHLHRRCDGIEDDHHAGQEGDVEQRLPHQLGPEAPRGEGSVKEQQFDDSDEAPDGRDRQAGEDVDPGVELDGLVGDGREASGRRVVRDQEHMVHEQPDHPEGDDPQDVAPGFRSEA